MSQSSIKQQIIDDIRKYMAEDKSSNFILMSLAVKYDDVDEDVLEQIYQKECQRGDQHQSYKYDFLSSLNEERGNSTATTPVTTSSSSARPNQPQTRTSKTGVKSSVADPPFHLREKIVELRRDLEYNEFKQASKEQQEFRLKKLEHRDMFVSSPQKIVDELTTKHPNVDIHGKTSLVDDQESQLLYFMKIGLDTEEIFILLNSSYGLEGKDVNQLIKKLENHPICQNWVKNVIVARIYRSKLQKMGTKVNLATGQQSVGILGSLKSILSGSDKKSSDKGSTSTSSSSPSQHQKFDLDAIGGDYDHLSGAQVWFEKASDDSGYNLYCKGNFNRSVKDRVVMYKPNADFIFKKYGVASNAPKYVLATVEKPCIVTVNNEQVLSLSART